MESTAAQLDMLAQNADAASTHVDNSALPDSTTFLLNKSSASSSTASEEVINAALTVANQGHPTEVQNNSIHVTVDTALDSFPDLFLTGGDQQQIFTSYLDPKKKDILALAANEVKSNSSEMVEMVSSTIHGFPVEDDDEEVSVTAAVSPKLVESNDENEPREENNSAAVLANVIAPVFTSSDLQDQQQPQPLLVIPQQQAQNDFYTLTLTDGSVVQLKVQPPPNQQQAAQNHDQQLNEIASLLKFPSLSTTSGNSTSTNTTNSTNSTSSCSESADSAHEDDLMWAELCSASDRASSNASPPSIAAEVTLPFNDSGSNPSSPSTFVPSSAVRRTSSSSSASTISTSSDYDGCDEALLSMFSSMDSVTIEALKAQLTTLPEGQTADLGALLVAAKIDLTVEDIVGPPLTQVKRIMEQKKLSDWQVQLCIKIRRRKKNTAAVRSSRRKRSQYVVGLREQVADLMKRKREANDQNTLLKTLHSLWERLCSEVEAEIQEGVRKQLGIELNKGTFQLPDELPQPPQHKRPRRTILEPKSDPTPLSTTIVEEHKRNRGDEARRTRSKCL